MTTASLLSGSIARAQSFPADVLYELPNTPNGPQARTRAELDTFGRVMESDTPAGIIATAEAFVDRYPKSQLLPMVRLREMRAEMEVNSYEGAVAIGRELLPENPRNLEALLLMASILPNFPPQDASRRAAILAEARKDIEAAGELLQTLHMPQGASAEEFLINKRRLKAALAEARGFVDLVAGQSQQAIREYRWALAHGGNPSPVTSLRLGQAYYMAGDLKNARAELKLAMRSNSGVIRRKAAQLLQRISSG
ncbi:MAG: tetratricopeptide repeat protein [Terriglobia bacterium]